MSFAWNGRCAKRSLSGSIDSALATWLLSSTKSIDWLHGKYSTISLVCLLILENVIQFLSIYFSHSAAVVILLGGILMLTRTAALSKHLANPLELSVTWEAYAFVSCKQFKVKYLLLIRYFNIYLFILFNSLCLRSQLENVGSWIQSLFYFGVELFWFHCYGNLNDWSVRRGFRSLDSLSRCSTFAVSPWIVVSFLRLNDMHNNIIIIL